jgi:hypothetical protein
VSTKVYLRPVQVRSLGEARDHIESLMVNNDELAHRLRFVEELLDTRATPWPRRLLYRIDGWGPWWQVREQPRWRPWRRWYVS